ncbi:hypothetical protein [Streptomyces sp. CAU 1734]|uniref:hypothetical protein n=1 Tax=Streptomyces sp. CAU 1734 TaxID=3140360 RepID=UPI00326121EA
MSRTTPTTPIPTTPAAVAAAVLGAIEDRPDMFNMNYWVNLPEYGYLLPEETPSCGTTLCAAGWAARLTGWTIHERDDGGPGVEMPDGCFTTSWAEKDGIREYVGIVGAHALGLDPEETFFHSTADVALNRLRLIAGE